ncbi:MAG: hypothetical protein ABJA11_05445, partial [Pseudolysinimonas sp.]
MTEREIPDAAGFHFGGKTDDLSTESAPLVLSEPEKRPTEALATTSGVGFSSRREARAAGQFSVDAAAVAPAYAGVASLFPLLEDVAVSPVSPDSPASPNLSDDLATQAMPIAEVEAELSTPVAPYVVPQDTPVAFVPVSIVPVSTVPPVAEPRPQT